MLYFVFPSISIMLAVFDGSEPSFSATMLSVLTSLPDIGMDRRFFCAVNTYLLSTGLPLYSSVTISPSIWPPSHISTPIVSVCQSYVFTLPAVTLSVTSGSATGVLATIICFVSSTWCFPTTIVVSIFSSFPNSALNALSLSKVIVPFAQAVLSASLLTSEPVSTLPLLECIYFSFASTRHITILDWYPC